MTSEVPMLADMPLPLAMLVGVGLVMFAGLVLIVIGVGILTLDAVVEKAKKARAMKAAPSVRSLKIGV